VTWSATCGSGCAAAPKPRPLAPQPRAQSHPPFSSLAPAHSSRRPRSQVNLIAAALYHVYVKFIIGEMNLSTMDMVLYNNAMSIPLLVVLGLLLDK